MEANEQITLAKSLIEKRQEIDEQLAALFAGATALKNTCRCKVCNGEGRSTSTCPERPDKTPTA